MRNHNLDDQVEDIINEVGQSVSKLYNSIRLFSNDNRKFMPYWEYLLSTVDNYDMDQFKFLEIISVEVQQTQ